MYNHWLKWKINNKIISNNWGWKWIKKRRSNYFFINWNKIKDSGWGRGERHGRIIS